MKPNTPGTSSDGITPTPFASGESDAPAGSAEACLDSVGGKRGWRWLLTVPLKK